MLLTQNIAPVFLKKNRSYLRVIPGGKLKKEKRKKRLFYILFLIITYIGFVSILTIIFKLYFDLIYR